MCNVDKISDVIKWNFDDGAKTQEFHREFDKEIRKLRSNFCMSDNCRSTVCRGGIDDYFGKFCSCVTSVGKKVFGTNRNRKFSSIPGWKDFVKDYHDHA